MDVSARLIGLDQPSKSKCDLQSNVGYKARPLEKLTSGRGDPHSVKIADVAGGSVLWLKASSPAISLSSRSELPQALQCRICRDC